MKLSILSVAYPLALVSEDSVGGAEQVLRMIDEALISRGRRSIVVAPEGSRVRGALISIPRPRGLLTEFVRQSARLQTRLAIAKALDQYSIDLVHMHGIDFGDYLPAENVPVLATLHLPVSWYPREVFSASRPNTFFNCVSVSQMRTLECSSLLPPIENGIQVHRFAFTARKRKFALALGRICPEKGFHLAIEAAEKANVPLVLAGEVFRYETHESYFQHEIAPRLSRTIRFASRLDFRRKRKLLASARCLLIPSLVPETSSLVAMEALASGTPVIAFPAGALADIVEHGKTGYLVSTAQEMAEAIASVQNIDPRDCRQAALDRYNSDRMVAGYFEAYERILSECSRAVTARKSAALI